MRSEFQAWGEGPGLSLLLSISVVGYRSETADAATGLTSKLACPPLSLTVNDEVEAAMRTTQQRTGLGIAGLKSAMDAFRQRSVRDRVTGRENFREVMRDIMASASMGLKRDGLAETLYDFLAARSPDSVHSPGVDLSGFAMALLVLTGNESYLEPYL